MIIARIRNNEWWDSWLYSDAASPQRNADLYLIIKVELRRRDPSTGIESIDSNGYCRLQNWGARWEPWKRQVKSSIEDVWNNRVWMVPPGPWGPFGTASRPFIPNIKCSLDIQIVETGGQARIECFRPAEGQRFQRSFLGHASEGRSVTGSFFESVVETSNGQTTSAHEMGHYLNLFHVNRDRCGPNPNAPECYGVTPGQREDLMGRGNRVGAWHMFEWRRRLPYHFPGWGPYESSCDNWTFTTDRPAPQRRAAA
jgi:hypothetical protein